MSATTVPESAMLIYIASLEGVQQGLLHGATSRQCMWQHMNVAKESADVALSDRRTSCHDQDRAFGLVHLVEGLRPLRHMCW